METFYLIVLSIAFLFYIFIITSFGIMMTKGSSETVFPPTKNTCPDYWTVNTQGDVNYCKINSGRVNAGNLPTDLTNEPGYSSNGFNFAASGLLPSNPTATGMCAMKTWANQKNISWDGVSNFNGC